MSYLCTVWPMTLRTSDREALIRFFQPSVLSMVTAVILGLTAVAALILAQLFNSVQIADYIDYTTKNPSTVQVRFSQASEAINSSEMVADFATFIAWGLAGLVGYAAIALLRHGVKAFVDFEQNVEYFKQSRGIILREAFFGLFLRLGAIGLMIALYNLGFSAILPGMLVLVQYAFSSSPALTVGLLFTVFLIMFTIAHVLVVLTRLFMLRTRVFYGHYYIQR
jgi:hypothetical protein